jgi:biotin operon repressor
VTGPDDGVGARWGKVPLRVTVDLAREGQALAVYCVLAAHADDRGRCYPSQATIADLLGVSARTVKRAVARLQQVGHVRVLEQGGGRGRSTHYLLPAQGRKGVTRVTPGVTNDDRKGGTLHADEHLEQRIEQAAPPPRRLIERARAGVWRGLADEAEP